MSIKHTQSIFKIIFYYIIGANTLIFLVYLLLNYTFFFRQIKATINSNQNTSINLFINNIENDLLSGIYPDVYRKCEALQKAENISYIKILTSANYTICEFKKSSIKNHVIEERKIYFDSNQNDKAAQVEIGFDSDNIERAKITTILAVIIVLIIQLILLYFIFKVVIRKYQTTVTKLLKYLEVNDLDSNQNTLEKLFPSIFKTHEFSTLILKILGLASNLKKVQFKIIEAEKQKHLNQVYTQVAHDIKSPLAALELVMDDIRELPEDSRELTLNAINRIQEIANNLSKEAKTEDKGLETSTLISYPIRAIINEKRLELQSKSKLSIELTDNTNQMNFIDLTSTEISRIISNLVNNAAEALGYEGQIFIQLDKIENDLKLIIRDDGKGFPASMLNMPIKRGNTIGKEKGQGLGLHHAFETIMQVKGDFKIYNNNGAIIEIVIPISLPPVWFCSRIDFSSYSKIIVIDDDKSIHDLWSKIFKDKKISNDVIHLQNNYEITKGIKNIGNNDLVLIDFDLRFQQNGIEIISEHQFKNVILVTSGHEQKTVQEFCISHQIKLLPKYLIGRM